MHVDAAYAGVAAILPEQRAGLDGLELADSFDTNCHKCGAFHINVGVSSLARVATGAVLFTKCHKCGAVHFT